MSQAEKKARQSEGRLLVEWVLETFGNDPRAVEFGKRWFKRYQEIEAK
jgi:hypothetical protein